MPVPAPRGTTGNRSRLASTRIPRPRPRTPAAPRPTGSDSPLRGIVGIDRQLFRRGEKIGGTDDGFQFFEDGWFKHTRDSRYQGTDCLCIRYPQASPRQVQFALMSSYSLVKRRTCSFVLPTAYSTWLPVFMMKAQSELCASSSSRAAWLSARTQEAVGLAERPGPARSCGPRPCAGGG